ncbi:hypothetical protein [Thiothrix nivea]|uniref:Sulfotransferase family protein n=1 Tax=Thiothrix nivea (strain ATCC 35100 / DSM 5205 / JP2) TaxID=870187 RepID=A0A656HIZ6_THINJ|nr:hypothetical protein [Thiothrix nivea]EIJ36172.1 hypothetical protein Thini_3668 [Thiothrix nivea DSM 5205]
MPQPYQRIFLLSHMRAYSSLIGHILGSHPQINGYYEIHISYNTAKSLARQEQRYAQHDRFKPGSRFLFDKLLHNGYEPDLALPGLENACVLLALRKPEETIKSILKLFREKNTDAPYSYPVEATGYYVGRMEKLIEFARQHPQRYYYFDTELVCTDTAGLLQSLADWLQLDTPLSEQYQRFAKTGVAGAGDTSEAINSGTIIKNAVEDFSGVTLEDSLLQQAEQAYQECREQLIRNARAATYANN